MTLSAFAAERRAAARAAALLRVRRSAANPPLLRSTDRTD